MPYKLNLKNKTSQKFNETKTNFNVRTHFQKKLMSDAYIVKYKQTCVELLKNNEEIKSIWDSLIKNNNFESFLNEKLFTNSTFLYKLEDFLASDSTLTKIKKENFFKREIKKTIKEMIIDRDIDNSLKNVQLNFLQHIKNISEYEF